MAAPRSFLTTTLLLSAILTLPVAAKGAGAGAPACKTEVRTAFNSSVTVYRMSSGATGADTAPAAETLTATVTDPNNNGPDVSECLGHDPAAALTSAPTPTPAASPTGNSAPTVLLGDTDCDEDLDSVDALWVLREIALIGTPPACIDQGDVQCDGDRDSVDSLGILRFVVRLPPVSQQSGCPPVGPVRALNLGDNYFDPDEITLEAGSQVTLLVLNVGEAVHNVRVEGPDGRWDTADDVLSDPNLVMPDATARLAVAFDTPGDYEFRCDFHPADQVGVIHVTQTGT